MPANLIFMLVDDWGSYDATFRMKTLGRQPDIQTPNIDLLRSEGYGFSNYYVQPICSPTRAVLMSGRYSSRDGVEDKLFGSAEPSCLPTNFTIFPQALKNAFNYSTHMIGKWHLGFPDEACCPWKRGFDSYLGYLNGVEGYRSHGCGPYMDFHECSNEPIPGPLFPASTVQYAPHPAAPLLAPTYDTYTGALTAGGDLGKANMTLAAAEAHCDGLHACTGFTYKAAAAGGSSSAAAEEQDGDHAMFFKSTLERNDDPQWRTYLKHGKIPPAPPTCRTCTQRYEGHYSAHVYAQRAVNIIAAHAARWYGPGSGSDSGSAAAAAARPGLFIYLAWQSVHEPMDAPDTYTAPYVGRIGDHSRRIYAGMLAALDEAVGNVTTAVAEHGMRNDTLLVMSNDNGGMSGTYGMGCCNCGTSCGGLNYPYRGWKDSFYEGGFRGIGILHAPGMLTPKSAAFEFSPLVHVSDWLPTFLAVAAAGSGGGVGGGVGGFSTSFDDLLRRAGLDPSGLDGKNQWPSLLAAAASAPASAAVGSVPDARTEILHALGLMVDKVNYPPGYTGVQYRKAAALRVGDFKLMLGSWGADTWCDLNYTDPAAALTGGDGGLVCTHLKHSNSTATSAHILGGNSDGNTSSSSSRTAVELLGVGNTASASHHRSGGVMRIERTGWDHRGDWVGLDGDSGGKGALAELEPESKVPWWNVTQLYNIKNDPRETRNLASDPAHAAVLARMLARIHALNTTILSTAHVAGNDPGSSRTANATGRCWVTWRPDHIPWNATFVP